MSIVAAVYLILPLLLAGAAHAPMIKRNVLPWLAQPLDLGRSFRGARLFGDNKTWRGVLVMSSVSVLVVFVQAQAYSLQPFRAISIVDYRRTSWVVLGLALGLSYSLSELPNSFVKRRLHIPPGAVARRGSAAQYVVDQADSVLGGTVVLALLLGLRWQTLALVFGLGFLLHVLVDQLFFLFAIKHRAALVIAAVDGESTC